MDLKHLLYTLLLAASAINAEEKAAPSKSEPSEKKSHSYLTPILKHLQGEKQDPTISFMHTKDPQNGASMIAVFEKIPGKTPYRLEYQRLLQPDPNQYIQAKEQQTVLNETRDEQIKPPFGLLLALNQYLPGERVTWRISSGEGNVLKQVTCCPNPLLIKNSAGDLLMEAALISPASPTCYVLFFPARADDIEFIFTVGTKQTKGKIPKGDVKMTTYEPALEGSDVGISKIELITKNKSYSLELPWGEQMSKKIKAIKTQFH